jgi:Asp-tRNA(Asn)/Glu-tRNA(Gln) amidotransferase B subunit
MDLLLIRSLIDLNRAGIALMEIVFHPDLKDGEEAGALVKELTLILQRIGTCTCRMEGLSVIMSFVCLSKIMLNDK